jgi:hypothetical protein
LQQIATTSRWPIACNRGVRPQLTHSSAWRYNVRSARRHHRRREHKPLRRTLLGGGRVNRTSLQGPAAEEGIEQLATMEHSRVSRAALRANAGRTQVRASLAVPRARTSLGRPRVSLGRAAGGRSGGRTRCALLIRYAFGDDTIDSLDSSPPSLGPPGRDPSGERACEWTSGRAGVTRS